MGCCINNMPLYEYKCDRCGKTFEVIQKFSDEPLKMHDECGGSVERLVSPPAFHFKGSGWYVTDYASKNGASGANGKHDAKKDATESKTEKKSETKSESKTESKPASTTSG